MKTSSAICFSSQNQCSALVMLIIAGNAAIVTRQMKQKVMGPIGKLNLTITWSVVPGDDVADTTIKVAEIGEDAGSGAIPGRCDMIAMATHGRAGLQHWVLGSVTERVLSATRLPILVVRPEE